MGQTLGQFLVNDVLPKQHRSDVLLDTKSLKTKLVAIAQEDPVLYSDVATKLKQVGDEFSTLEGISVGLDDIAPSYAARNKILHPALAAMKKATTSEEKEKIILDTQDKLIEHTKSHPGTLAPMAASGSRGNFPQLLKIVSSPVAALDGKGRITPWIISKSYAEGLPVSDFWVAGNEARQNAISAYTSVVEPGDLAKIFANNVYPQVVSRVDCGTLNGVNMSANDAHLRGRLLARDTGEFKRDTVISPAVQKKLRDKSVDVFVRSPITCESRAGVCSKCMGADSRGKLNEVGVNVGLRASQSIAEPLTQITLSARHGMRVLKGASKQLDGVRGVRQLVEIPDSFLHKATLAEHAGVVGKIVPAPHGGNYVHVGDTQHYAGPSLEVIVKPGQTVEAGDMLTDGIPRPDEIVKHKGLGAGRKYLADQLYDIYHRQGITLDKRHFELLARADLSHVQVLEASDNHPELLRGDIIHYNQYRDAVATDTHTVPLDKASGHVLGKEVFHFTVGTELTPSVMTTLKQQGVKEVTVAKNPPKVEFLMRPMTRTPLLNPDWMARLSFRYLKDSLLKGAHQGQKSELHSHHPVPGYAAGSEFGTGTEGRY